MNRVGSIVGCSMIALVLLASVNATAQTTAEARADRAESRSAPPPPPPPPPSAPAPSSMGSGGSGPSSSSGGGNYAVPRSPRGDGGSVRGGGSRAGARQGLEIANEDQQRRGGNATGVPPYSRPRPDGQPAVGNAAPRRTAPPSRNPGGSGIYPGYYYPYGIGAYGFGYFYDPFLWSPYGFGYGSYYGYPYGSSYGYGGGGYGGGYVYGGSAGGYRDAGSIRLKVKPEEAQIFVDGYFAGTVDDYDGIFQRLTLTAGAHRVEIRAPGYQSHSFEVQIVPGETITYRGDLVRETR